MKADSPIMLLWRGLTGQERKRRLLLLKNRTLQYPVAYEEEYFSMLRKYLVRRTASHMVDCLRFARVHQDADGIEADPPPPDYWALLAFARNVYRFNNSQWKPLIEVLYSGYQSPQVVDGVLRAEKLGEFGPAWEKGDVTAKQALEYWAKNQVTLITNADADMRNKVWKKVSEGVRNGWNESQIEELLLQSMPTISANRAKLIARDQISKLENTLDRVRMQTAGLETYIWRTAQDERVRGDPDGKYKKAVPSHYILDGKMCRWSDASVCRVAGSWVARPPKAELLHPGEAVQCRCIALPNWDEIEW